MLPHPGRGLSDGPIEADACVSSTPGAVCTVRVADCLPVLLSDTAGQVVAALQLDAVFQPHGAVQDGVAEAQIQLERPALVAAVGQPVQERVEPGQGDILARPSVLTAEQHKGIIASGQQIPYQETTHSGATTTRFVNAELSLEATPSVTAEGQVVLDLELKHDSPGEIQASGARAIETNRLKTQVRLSDNQTLMLGGIFRTQSVRSVSQVPVLGNIPLLGYLFRRHQVREDKQELLIFVTPRVLNASGLLPAPQTDPRAVETSDAANTYSKHLFGRAHGRGQDHHRAAAC